MHGTDECHPFKGGNGLQPVVVMVCENVSQRLGKANRKEPVPIVLITFDQSLTIIEFE